MITHKVSRNMIALRAIALISMLFVAYNARAQRYFRPNPRLYLGVEGGMGIRSFQITSDIEALHNMKVDEEGFNIGVMFGTECIQARVRKGFYHSSKTVNEKIDLKEFEFSANVFPLHVLGVKSKLVKPYLTTGMGQTNLTFIGSYALPELPSEEDNDEHSCHNGGGGMLPDPDQPGGALPAPAREEPAQETEEKELGRIKEVKFNVGLGALLMVPCERFFISFFAEARYGITANSTPTNLSFAKTSASNPLFINFGIGFGLKSN